MHNCKKAHPKKSHRRRSRTLRRTLAPLHFPEGWRSAEPGQAPKGTGILHNISKGRVHFGSGTTGAELAKSASGRLPEKSRVQIVPASMLRRLSTVVTRPFVYRTPSR